jgi:hypothetical protein
LVGIEALASPRHNASAVLEVRREDPVKSGEIQTWARHQSSQAGDKFQRFQQGSLLPD